MRTVLYQSMIFFALLLSFNAFGEDQQLNCRSWWSKSDGVRHCLLSGNGENDASLLPKKEIAGAKALPEDLSHDNDSPRNQLYIPPSEDISAPKEFELRLLPNFRKEPPF